MRLYQFIIPAKLKFFRKEFKKKSFRLLDVGCGKNSARITKYWYKNSLYYGTDWKKYNIDKTDLVLMEKFFNIDLEKSNLSEIEDSFFDVIIFTHVIEHLENGLFILKELTKKLKNEGKLYVEFPSIRSLSLPSAIGTLNFFDDDTHIRFYDLKDVVNVLLSNNIKIIKAGRRRDPSGFFTFILSIPLQAYTLVKHKKLNAKGLWDVSGFADYVYGKKR